MKNLFILAFFTALAMNCKAQNPDSLTIKYYAGWSGYEIPKNPQKEIKKNNLSEYSTFYKAYYDGNLLVKFEKFIDSELDWYDIYVYWKNSDKLKKHISVNGLGEKKIHHYNKKGKLMEKED